MEEHIKNFLVAQGRSVDIKEASTVFSEQMESGQNIAADYQSMGNGEHVGQRM